MKRIALLLVAASFTTQGLAMGQIPNNYLVPKWHNDARFIAYTARDVVVPGIPPEEKEALTQKCGVRMLEGYGDVVRSDEHLEQLKAMREYAEQYNKTVEPYCRAAKSKVEKKIKS
jgi:hypothetical protein